MSYKNNIWAWLPALLFVSIMYYMSSQANPPGAGLFEFIPNADKLAHMTEYFILSSLIYFALRKGHEMENKKAVLTAIIISAFIGITDEYHQSFVAGRSSDVLDWVADVVGAGIAGSTKMQVRGTKSEVQS
ncbi:MAG: VanZ family protein [Candidatus Firestonebacteria bacterium]